MRPLRRLLGRLRGRRRGARPRPLQRVVPPSGGVPMLVPHEALCPACSEWWRAEAVVRHLLLAHPRHPASRRIRSWLEEGAR